MSILMTDGQMIFSMNTNKETNNTTATPSKAHKAAFLTMTVMVALLTPVLLQGHLNVLFRDLFNPPVWIVLVPGLRVVSTLVCYAITTVAGGFLLHRSGIRKQWLSILFFVLTFLWTFFVAGVLYLIID